MPRLLLTVQALVFAAAAGAVTLGDARLSVVFSEQTGWPSEVFADGEQVLFWDDSMPVCLPNADIGAFASAFGKPARRVTVEPLGVTVLDARTAKTTVRVGPWLVDCLVELHPAERAVRYRYGITQDAEDRKRLSNVWTAFGLLPASKAGGWYRMPAKWPPKLYSYAQNTTRPGRRYHSNQVCPVFAAVGEAGWGAVLAGDQLPPDADHVTPGAFCATNGWSLLTRREVAGYVARGVRQTFGDDWLLLRRATDDRLLEAVREYHRLAGWRHPEGRPAQLRQTALYSLGLCGTSEVERMHTNGTHVVESYFPYLKALGVDTIWLRPIEDGNGGYSPNDYYRLYEHVGTERQVRAFVDAAHANGFRIWRDAVMHGGRKDCPRSLAHPEWLAWRDEKGTTDDYWCYDFYWPTWVAYFAEMIRDQTARYDLDGWRMDVPTGSRTPNWNPSIPYARASFARLQGGLAQQRAIRAAARAARPHAVTFAESNCAVHGNTADAIYDQAPCHKIFPALRNDDVPAVADALRRFFFEQQAVYLNDQVWARYPESHDSVRASLYYGRACATALFALSSWMRNMAFIYQAGEDGCFEAWRRILRIRKALPELIDGSADYLGVSAPVGVVAFLRELDGCASVVLINLNGVRACGAVTSKYGTFEVELPPFGYEVRRVCGAPLAAVLGDEPPAFEPPVAGPLGAVGPERVGDWTVYRFPGATRWFSHAADGSSESPWFRYYPGCGVMTPYEGHRRYDAKVRWDSALHPFGFTAEHAAVGVLRGDRALALTGLSPAAEVQVWDSVPQADGTVWEGLAIAVRGKAAPAVRELTAAEALAPRDAGTGDDRFALAPGGWQYESGSLRVRFRANGAVVGIWRRTADGTWRQRTGDIGFWTDTGRVESECRQSEDHDAVCRFEPGPGGRVRFVVSNAALRPTCKTGPTRVFCSTALCFDGETFALEAETHYSHLHKPGRVEWRLEAGADGRAATAGLDGEWRTKIKLAKGSEGDVFCVTCDPKLKRLAVAWKLEDAP